MTNNQHVLYFQGVPLVNRTLWLVPTRIHSIAASAPTTKTLISEIDYNEIGQVKAKNLHSTDSTTFLQPIAYTYNERGWLRTSSAGLFQMELQYNTGANKQYNGNIAYQLWGTQAAPNTNTFTYIYDPLNRLISGAANGADIERGISYDVMGNITALNRLQAGIRIDSLAYTYTGNFLSSIIDRSGNTAGLINGTTTYSPDGNGNVINNANAVNTSQNKSYTYNLLNLPQVITIPTGTVTYTYDATGRKLRKVSASTTTNTTEYIDGIQYLNSTTAIDFIQTEEGKAVVNGTGYNYQYYLGDNLGNTRVTFETKTGSAVLYQQDDYMPFGMEIPRNPVPSPKNEYLYNKKELQEELGQYDYGAWYYEPVIARWLVLDPMAEKGRRWSPYNYGFDNPIRFEDPDGMWPNGPIGDFFSSAASTFKNYFKSTVHAIAHPIETAKSITKADIANAALNVVTSGGYGMVKDAVKTVKAVNSAVHGDTKPLGAIAGNTVANITVAVATDGALNLAGKGLSAINTKILSNTVKNVATELKANGNAPATVGGAELNGQTSIATSGAPPTVVAPQIQEAAQSLGGIGAVNDAGTVGACCEIHAANSLLLEQPGATMGDLNLTPAIRPSSGKVIPMCDNCKVIFGKK